MDKYAKSKRDKENGGRGTTIGDGLSVSYSVSNEHAPYIENGQRIIYAPVWLNDPNNIDISMTKKIANQ